MAERDPRERQQQEQVQGPIQYPGKPGIIEYLIDQARIGNRGMQIHREVVGARPDAPKQEILAEVNQRLDQYRQQLRDQRTQQRELASIYDSRVAMSQPMSSLGNIFVRTVREATPQQVAREAQRQQRQQARASQAQVPGQPPGVQERQAAAPAMPGQPMSAIDEQRLIASKLQEVRVQTMVATAQGGQYAVSVPQPEWFQPQALPGLFSANALGNAPQPEPRQSQEMSSSGKPAYVASQEDIKAHQERLRQQQDLMEQQRRLDNFVAKHIDPTTGRPNVIHSPEEQAAIFNQLFGETFGNS